MLLPIFIYCRWPSHYISTCALVIPMHTLLCLCIIYYTLYLYTSTLSESPSLLSLLHQEHKERGDNKWAPKMCHQHNKYIPLYLMPCHINLEIKCIDICTRTARDQSRTSVPFYYFLVLFMKINLVSSILVLTFSFFSYYQRIFINLQ